MASSTTVVEVTSTVTITINHREPIERVTGPDGHAWRVQAYQLFTEADVLNHWAENCVMNAVVDINQLDGWADVKAGIVTMSMAGAEGNSNA